MGPQHEERATRGGLLWLFFSFHGRVGRAQYWVGHLSAAFVVLSLLGMLLGVVSMGARGSAAESIPAFTSLMLGYSVIAVPWLWVSFALAAKRLHDRGKSGWWSLASLVPYVGPMWVLVECGCLRGLPGENRFGPESADMPGPLV